MTFVQAESGSVIDKSVRAEWGVNLLLMKVIDHVDRDWFLEVGQFVPHGAAS